jgi:hypothetical protein
MTLAANPCAHFTPVTPFVHHGPAHSDAAVKPSATAAPLLLRLGAAALAISWAVAFAVSVVSGQEKAWPLRNISQYAAHYPAIYFFRTGVIGGALLIAQAGWILNERRRRWPLLLLPFGLCMSQAAAISCVENNTIHSGFAIAGFAVSGAIEACAAGAACASSQWVRQQFFRNGGPRPWPHAWFAGAAVVWLSLIIVACLELGVIDLSNELKGIVISLLEWGCTGQLLVFFGHLSWVVH